MRSGVEEEEEGLETGREGIVNWNVKYFMLAVRLYNENEEKKLLEAAVCPYLFPKIHVILFNCKSLLVSIRNLIIGISNNVIVIDKDY